MKKFWYKSSIGTIAINMYPIKGPYGGSNVFVQQFAEVLKRHRYQVRYDLKKKVDIILLIDPRDDLEHKAFGIDDITTYKKTNPSVKVLHRINECDKRKGTDFMDDLLQGANTIADYTVFISEWLRDYFIERWFNPDNPHKVIYNGADPTVFHPVGGDRPSPGKPFRIVTHHWSDNPMKGFPVYQQLDRMLAAGEISNCEFWLIGRWPAQLQWQKTMLHPPAYGVKLAGLLRSCHLYLTASLWEPCGMHHIEGAQCGLPLLFHADGGGIVEAGDKYGVPYRKDLKSALDTAIENYSALKNKLFTHMPSGEFMCLEYMKVVQQMMAGDSYLRLL